MSVHLSDHLSDHRTLPQPRAPRPGGVRPLSVVSTTTDALGCLALRGDAPADALDPLLAAIDGLFAVRVRAIVLDCTEVSSWSQRCLEIAVLTATRAHEQRIAFAACGLPPEQLDLLRRQWPGVHVHQFAHSGRRSAEDALLSQSS